MKRLVPERLIAIREKQGWSPAEAARRTSLERTAYYKYETGEVVPTAPTLQILALFLGTSVDYLCGLTDDPSPNLLAIPVDESGDELFYLVKNYQGLKEDYRTLIRQMIKALSEK